MSFPKAYDKYREFHAFDPRSEGPFHSSFKIPKTIHFLGTAKFVLYSSDKWNPGKKTKYIHDFGKGVKCYAPGAEGRSVQVPKKFRNVEVLVCLGKCLGLGFEVDGEEYETKEMGLELFCSTHETHPALYIVKAKRDLVAMAWGGQMHVEDRGIVD